ncbi:MAG: hypothetical protein LIP05_07970 [Tannerellaceae bacterium]|nr:hypothetical protein [Tannerellaceae bacterium]
MKKIVLLTCNLLLMLISCSDDSRDLTENPTGPVTAATDQDVEVGFLPVTAANGSVLFSDEDVAELDLLVFKAGQYAYRRTAYTSQYTTCRSTLQIDENLDIYFFANCRSALTDEVLVEGDSWEVLRERVVIQFTDTVIRGSRVVPMWGQVKGVRVSEDVVNRFDVKLLRSVASANIIFDLQDAGSLPFQPVVAYLYYGSDCGYLAPSPENLKLTDGELEGVWAAQSPDWMRTIRKVQTDFNEETGAFSAPFLMFDNETSETDRKHLDNRRSRLVVGGYLNGSSILTHYPLDFFSMKAGSEGILDVTRNNQYNLTITAVKGEGWTDPDEAAENAAVNLEYEVIDWDRNNDTDIAVDGPDYVSIVRKVTLHAKQGSTADLRMTTTFRKEDIRLSFPSSLNNANPHAVESVRFRAELQESGSRLVIRFTALEDYAAADPSLNHDQLLLEAGRIRFYIDIEQLSTKGWQYGGEEDVHF